MKYACNFILKNNWKTFERESLFLPLLSKYCPPVVTEARHNMKTIFNLLLLIFVIHVYYKCITAQHIGAERNILFQFGFSSKLFCGQHEQLHAAHLISWWCVHYVCLLFYYLEVEHTQVLFTGRSLSEDMLSYVFEVLSLHS